MDALLPFQVRRCNFAPVYPWVTTQPNLPWAAWPKCPAIRRYHTPDISQGNLLAWGIGMTRKSRDQLFKRSDFARLVAAARSEGLPIARIDVIRDGLSLVVGEPVKNGSAEANPLDQWIAKHADQAEGA